MGLLMTRTACLLLTLAASVATLSAGQQGGIFRSGARTVPIYATVIDKSGRLIPDLTKDDFQIFDNGKLQPTALFANDIQNIRVAIMLDMSGSMTMSYDLLKQAAEQFVLRMLPDDQARIGAFADVVRMSPHFTGNRDELISVLRNDIDFGNGTALWDAVDQGMNTLASLDGRRVVLVFTDGDDNESRHSLTDEMKRAQNEEFMIYAIGLRSQVLGESATHPDAGLKKIAAETGGGYFELLKTSDLGPTFTRVATELHSQYVLGFTPTDLDGKLHKIEVRSKDPALIVRARKSYIATKDK
jgi:VWFA-related protein